LSYGDLQKGLGLSAVASMTPKQERFVEEYLVDLNATQAAIRAGYSERTAYEIGHQNLRKVEVQEALQTAFAARSQRVEIDQDWVVRRLARIADLDLRKLFAEDGTLRPIHELPEDVVGAISSVDVVKRKDDAEEYRVRLPDRIRALDLLGRHLGIFRDRVEVTGRGLEPLLPELTDEELLEHFMAKVYPGPGKDREYWSRKAQSTSSSGGT
jgi:phage terminase small subunit